MHTAGDVSEARLKCSVNDYSRPEADGIFCFSSANHHRKYDDDNWQETEP